jgi:diguanylate cyclase (GGDEF)-like protein
MRISPRGLQPSITHNLISQSMKRLFDIVASSIGLLLLSPLFLLIAILIKHDSPGPIFFWCQRMGRNGYPFRMLKFRTMYERPSSYQGPPVTCKGDDRITPMGHWLRDTKINELPQLWNVLIGEMSMVGPRPEDVNIALEWPADIRTEILSVRPGITSPASIIYHDEEHKLSRANVMAEYIQNILPDKMRLDRLYVRNHSTTADLDIIFWTVVIIVPQIARITIPEGLLFFGPFSRFIHRYANWFIIDLAISLLIVSAIGFLWRLQMPLNWGVNLLIPFAVGLAFLFSGVNALTGLNKIVWSYATVEDGIQLVLTNTSVTFVILLINYLQAVYGWLKIPPLPLVMILSIGLLAQFGFVAARFRFRILTSIASRWLRWRRFSPGVGERVLIVGLGEEFNIAVWLLRREEFRYIFSIVGVVDDDAFTQMGMKMNDCVVLGRTAEIPVLVGKYDVGVIIIATTEVAPEVKDPIISLCQSGDLRLAFVNQMVEILSQQITRPVAMPEHLIWSQDRLKYFALYDAVTGLPNRFLFLEQLNRSFTYSRRYLTMIAALFFHLEGFSTYCEQYAPETRIDLLKQITSRLLQHKRESDTLAYLDNDEFGLLLEHIPDEGIVYFLAKRIQKLLSEPFIFDNRKVSFSPKISVCTNISDCVSLDRIRSEEIELVLNSRKPVFISEGD